MNNTPPPLNVPMGQPKKGLSTGCVVALVIGGMALVGIPVVAVLLSLAVPAFHKVQVKAHMAKVKNTSRILVIAVKSYQVEYNRLPTPSTTPPTTDGDINTTTPDGITLLRILIGEDATGNPRKIPFAEFYRGKPGAEEYTNETGLRDAWGNGYRVILDFDGDGKVQNPSTGQLYQSATLETEVAVYSAGPDGDFSTWSDNVSSWR